MIIFFSSDKSIVFGCRFNFFNFFFLRFEANVAAEGRAACHLGLREQLVNVAVRVERAHWMKVVLAINTLQRLRRVYFARLLAKLHAERHAARKRIVELAARCTLHIIWVAKLGRRNRRLALIVPKVVRVHVAGCGGHLVAAGKHAAHAQLRRNAAIALKMRTDANALNIMTQTLVATNRTTWKIFF